jgi:hypothetical protein
LQGPAHRRVIETTRIKGGRRQRAVRARVRC